MLEFHWNNHSINVDRRLHDLFRYELIFSFFSFLLLDHHNQWKNLECLIKMLIKILIKIFIIYSLKRVMRRRCHIIWSQSRKCFADIFDQIICKKVFCGEELVGTWWWEEWNGTCLYVMIGMWWWEEWMIGMWWWEEWNERIELVGEGERRRLCEYNAWWTKTLYRAREKNQNHLVTCIKIMWLVYTKLVTHTDFVLQNSWHIQTNISDFPWLLTYTKSCDFSWHIQNVATLVRSRDFSCIRTTSRDFSCIQTTSHCTRKERQ